MPPQGSPPFVPRSRLLILGWLIAWVSTVPLFHIHLPDHTDWWSLLNGGGPHTVLTPDLPGEYAAASHDSRRDGSNHLATRVINSPEMGFIVFGEHAERWETFGPGDARSHFHTASIFRRLAVTFAASRAPPRWFGT
jgi:hypothetical protein